MTAASMVNKVKAAYQARTGQTMQEGTFNVLLDLCTGIIEEIQQNAKVQPGISVTTTTGSGATTAEGTIQ